jgi:hypothetical protein
MSSIFNNFWKQIGRGDNVKDYRHASRLFVDDNYALSPKYSWLYHVFFDLNPELSQIRNTNRLAEHGMLVKSAELPKFNVLNKTFNEYNRPNIVQTKVNMDQVQLVFHDDQSNVIRDLWYDYYSYYYRDVDIGYMNGTGTINPAYFAPSKYDGGPRDQLNRFGFTPRNYDSRGESQYIQAIRIYSLHQKKFSEYTLVNPYITSFKHGRHEANPGNDILDHTMTISYETVLYASGYVTQNTVKGFADLHYDKSPSPLTPQGSGTNSILGPGGILDAATTIFQQGSAGTAKGIGAAAFTLFRATEKNKNIDLRNLAQTELVQIGKDILNGKNPLDRTFFPSRGSGSAITFPQFSSAPQSPAPAAGSATSNNQSVNSAQPVSLINSSGFGQGSPVTSAFYSGAATVLAGGAFSGQITPGQITQNISGATSNSDNTLAGGNLNTVYNVDKSGSVTAATPQTSYDYFASSLRRYQDETRAKLAAISGQATTLATNLPQGFTSQLNVAAGVKVFATGTDTVVNGTTNILAQTPGLGGIVPGSDVIASATAQNFIADGNAFNLVPGSNSEIIGLSTPPIG